MIIRKALISDQTQVLALLDEFRSECMLQISGEYTQSDSASTKGKEIYQNLLSDSNYAIFVAENENDELVGIITGLLHPMLRSGEHRAEVEEFFVKKTFQGTGLAQKLMDEFFDWCIQHKVSKVNLESDNALLRAHSFYKKYGFETTAKRFVKKISKDQRSWWVYIVECEDGSYYTGITPDINKRIEKHNNGTGAKYTKFRTPVELLYYEKHKNRSWATKQELEIKKLTHQQKKELIDNFFPAD